jgi:hypothetical protein
MKVTSGETLQEREKTSTRTLFVGATLGAVTPGEAAFDLTAPTGAAETDLPDPRTPRSRLDSLLEFLTSYWILDILV